MQIQKIARVFLGFTLLLGIIAVLGGGDVFADDPDPGQDPESGEAASLATAKTCDFNAPPKYYCTWIRYVASGANNWELRKRLYKGAIDGGAVAWQLWYAKDWWWDGNQWVHLVTWPTSAWFTNVPLIEKPNKVRIIGFEPLGG